MSSRNILIFSIKNVLWQHTAYSIRPMCRKGSQIFLYMTYSSFHARKVKINAFWCHLSTSNPRVNQFINFVRHFFLFFILFFHIQYNSHHSFYSFVLQSTIFLRMFTLHLHLSHAPTFFETCYTLLVQS